MKVPYIPEDAPFSEEQKFWLAGFFARLHSRLLVLGNQPEVTTTHLHILSTKRDQSRT